MPFNNGKLPSVTQHKNISICKGKPPVYIYQGMDITNKIWQMKQLGLVHKDPYAISGIDKF